jgi:hypothetical protein
VKSVYAQNDHGQFMESEASAGQRVFQACPRLASQIS